MKSQDWKAYAVKCLTPKIKNWCQNGVKPRKSDDYKEEKVLQTLKIKGLQKKSQKISTHHLTLLKTACYIISRTKDKWIS